MNTSNTIFKLQGSVQHYAWGGYNFIPDLLNINNNENKPFAEYWLGTHPIAPSNLIINDQPINLSDAIKKNATTILGDKVVQQFNELPFLLKILDVRDMLSIQVHPTKEQALKGFEDEEAAGIAINAPNRNYKDKNHKPEVMIALSEFWLLHGFRNADVIEKILADIPEFTVLQALFKNQGYKALYQLLMEMEQEQVNSLLLPLIKRELRKKRDGELNKTLPGWWVAKLYENKNELKNLDRGIFSIYFLNIVQLQIGEAIFQAAGIPHAYLEGQNVELMANSDNVLRGGLTPKHIDVGELLKLTLFEAITPKILQGNTLGKEKVYPCPVADFGICKIQLQAGESYSAISTSLEILIITEGALLIKNQENTIVKKGECLAIFANTEYQFTASGNTILFKAFVP